LKTTISDTETTHADDASELAWTTSFVNGAIGSQTLTTGVCTFGGDISISSDVTFDVGSKADEALSIYQWLSKVSTIEEPTKHLGDKENGTRHRLMGLGSCSLNSRLNLQTTRTH
jgi:hypothetical protein